MTRAVGPDQLANPRDLALDEMTGRPVGRAAADLKQEVVEDLPPARRVRDLGMELDAEERALAGARRPRPASCRSTR